MLKQTTANLHKAGVLGKLVADYLQRKDTLKPFYAEYPDKAGFQNFLHQSPYTGFDRKLLSERLMVQANQVTNSSAASRNNIALLTQDTTYTVTTGHQLCLFTGPLYFVYKLLSTINLANALQQEFPSHRFVPVYWMASEDHDFEEISSFTVNGRSFKWHSQQSGAVGDFDPRELKQQMGALREVLGISQNADGLFKLFEKSYLQHATLASATRFLVNELFGSYGLVIIDGNDASFKQQMVPVFKADLNEGRAYQLVQPSVEKLAQLGYQAQVTPRAVNSFFLDKGLRARIDEQEGTFLLNGTDRALTAQELNTIVETQPEKLSPNVVLRPVYQQLILPNIAYVGGPGELAYWLEFKALFDALHVVFPILVPRNFVTVVDRGTVNKAKQTGFAITDFFQPAQSLVKDYMRRSGQQFDLDNELKQAADLYLALGQRTALADTTLEKHVAAEWARVQKKLKAIGEKANRALKRKAATELERIHQVKHLFFPGGQPQERHENLAALWLNYGPGIVEELRTHIVPFDFSAKVLLDEPDSAG